MDGEELLWELAGLEAELDEAGAAGAGRELPEAALQGYRSGQMTDPECDRLEAVLIASRRERRRLEAVAGVRIPAPISVRRRLFGDAGGVVAGGVVEARSRAGRREAPWSVLAAAAAVIAVLALLGLWQAKERGLLPGIHRGAVVQPIPECRVEIVGAASLRSLPGGSGTGAGAGAEGGVSGPRGVTGPTTGHETLPETPPVTLPETVVEISVLPETAPSTPVEFGLYRLVDGGRRLRRVPPGDIQTLEENRGAARIRLTAASLVGETIGTHTFFIVVTGPGALQDEVPVTGAATGTGVGAATAVEALQAASGGRVYERTLTIAARESGAESH